MPKRKKNLRVPNGWGSVRYLGKNRRLPYAVHPPATERDEKGFYIRPKALCYVPDWYTGFAVLSAYHAGRYEPGMEVTISREVEQSTADLDAFCLRILRDNGMADRIIGKPTLDEAWQKYWEWKFGDSAIRDLSDSAKYAYKQGYGYLSELKDKPLDDISIEELQKIVNDCDKKRATRTNIVLTAKQIWKFAVSREMCEKNTAQYLVVPGGRENEHGVPFSDRDLELLWQKVDCPDSNYMAEMILIMCHAGYRVDAWKTIKVNLTEETFFGGNKTAAGKNLVTPIHSDVLPLVKRRLKRYGTLINLPVDSRFRPDFKQYCIDFVGVSHTPHDTKHTFSRLCEKYGVREVDRKRLMGHALNGDITNQIYGHRSINELKMELEKIHTKN